MMKALIIDDNPVKAAKIKKSILKLRPDVEVDLQDNYQDAKWALIDCDSYDFICLDWEFPDGAGGNKPKANGGRILELLMDYGFDIPVIICSSANIKSEGELFQYVVEHVYFRPLDPEMDRFEAALKKLKHFI